MEKTDIVIIGAGPAGISAALYLKRAGASFVWLEKGAPGGKLINIHEVGNYPGIPNANGFDLAMSLLKSTEAVNASSTYGEVKSVKKENDLFITSTENESYESKAVIVATGFSNVPSIPGEKEHLSKGVSYCATCDGPLYRQKPVALYGRGDKVLEEAIYLAALASKVTILTPDEEYQGNELMKEVLSKKENVEFVYNAKITKILGEQNLTSIEYTEKDEAKEMEIAALFPLFGEKSASSFLSPLGVETNKGFLKVDVNMASSVEGLFAAGDIVDKTLRQVVTAASDGAIAATSALSFLRKRK